MKNNFSLILVVALFFSGATNAQVGIGTNTPKSSAALDVTSTTKGFLPPRMNLTQMNAITSPAVGLMVYCHNCFPIGIYSYNGTFFSSWLTQMPSGTKSGTVLDRNYDDGIHNFVYYPIVASDGKTWLNNNLGAHYAKFSHASYKPAQQATSATDYLAYGSLFQWGRKPDGHELITYTSTTAASAVNGMTSATAIAYATNPPDALFILVPFDFYTDWRGGAFNNNLWAWEESENNPCPNGYRVPTIAELSTLLTSESITNTATAASSTLKLTAAGSRDRRNGNFLNVSTIGTYWSGTSNGDFAVNSLKLTSSTQEVNQSTERAHGMSIRCMKD